MNANAKVYSVKELNQAVRLAIESKFDSIEVEGEVSRPMKAASGHVYFTLKDEFAQISCALFRGNLYRSMHSPKDGDRVIALGNPSIYSQRGDYQFIVRNVRLAGEGDLLKQYEQLKKKLKDRGYFEQGRKRPITKCPERVGIITSASGAAVHDIIRAFARRLPSTNLLIYPTLVQGESAAKNIAEQIKLANSRKEVDVLIISRGGGSIEDLWAFNKEIVATAIFQSELPIVTGIGHETDLTIADLVGDSRAATPTAAAEMLSTPTMQDMINELKSKEHVLATATKNHLNQMGQRVDFAHRGLVHPKEKISYFASKFDHTSDQLKGSMLEQIRSKREQSDAIRQHILAKSPVARIDASHALIDHLRNTIHLRTAHRVSEIRSSISSLHARLESMDPDATLKRGFAIVRRKHDNAVLRNSGEVTTREKVVAQLHSGALHCEVEKIVS